MSHADNLERPEALAGLLPDADPDQFRSIRRRLSSAADRERALAAILPAINVPAQGDLHLAQRQARLAPDLLEFSRPELVWPMFIHRDDPSLRTELIHIMTDYEVDPKILFERLKVETDRSVRRALIVALGGFAPERIPSALRADLKVLAKVILVQLRPRIPASTGAIDWVLRQAWSRRRRVERHRSRAVRAGGPIRSELVHQFFGSDIRDRSWTSLFPDGDRAGIRPVCRG